METLAEAAGFDGVETEVVEVAFEPASRATYADFIIRRAGPIKVLTSRRPDELRRRPVERIAQRARAFRRADGSVRLPSENLILHGIRPPA